MSINHEEASTSVSTRSYVSFILYMLSFNEKSIACKLQLKLKFKIKINPKHIAAMSDFKLKIAL